MCCDTYGTYKTIFSSTVENIVSGSLALEYFINRFIYIFQIKKIQQKHVLHIFLIYLIILILIKDVRILWVQILHIYMFPL